eukprot:ctg_4701.g743
MRAPQPHRHDIAQQQRAQVIVTEGGSCAMRQAVAAHRLLHVGVLGEEEARNVAG